MRIAAITRFKHGKIYEILKRLKWTQRKLSDETGIPQGRIGHIINLYKRPSVKEADAIQKALGNMGEFIDVLQEWPETFQGLKEGFKHEQIRDVEMLSLENCPEAMMLLDDERENSEELSEVLNDVMSEIPDNQKSVLEQLFIEGKTMKEIADHIGVCTATIAEWSRSGLRRLRHPHRIRKLEDFHHQ